MYVQMPVNTHRGQKTVSDVLELELHVVVSHLMWVLGRFQLSGSYLPSHLFSLRTLIHNMEIKCIYLQGSRLYKYSLPMSQSVVDEKKQCLFSHELKTSVFLL